MKDKLLLERLAGLEHRQWVHWARYMLSLMKRYKVHEVDNVPHVRRWRKLIKTPYGRLSGKEKEEDRKWARKVLKIMKN